MPIKKYYRLSGGANTIVYNSPNRWLTFFF
jgi:hypothetical protein